MKFVVLLLSMSAALPAQGLKVTQPPRNCHIFEQRFDNPFSDTKGYWQPAVAWHAEYALGSLGLSYGLHRFLHFPSWLAAGTVTVGIGIAPHVRSVLIKRTYPINPGDIAFDLWDRATPAFWAVAHKDDSTKIAWKSHLRSTGTWLIGYALLACFASP